MSAARAGIHVEFDVDRVLAELGRRFPGVSVWFGAATGRWWGLVRDRAGRDVLVEAADPATLGRRLNASRMRGLRPVRRNTPPPPAWPAGHRSGEVARPIPATRANPWGAVAPSVPPMPSGPAGDARVGGLRAVARRVRRALEGEPW